MPMPFAADIAAVARTHRILRANVPLRECIEMVNSFRRDEDARARIKRTLIGEYELKRFNWEQKRRDEELYRYWEDCYYDPHFMEEYDHAMSLPAMQRFARLHQMLLATKELERYKSQPTRLRNALSRVCDMQLLRTNIFAGIPTDLSLRPLKPPLPLVFRSEID